MLGRFQSTRDLMLVSLKEVQSGPKFTVNKKSTTGLYEVGTCILVFGAQMGYFGSLS